MQWKDTDPAQLMDSKLKCTFVMPEGSDLNNGSSVGMPSSIGSEAPVIKSEPKSPSSPKVREGTESYEIMNPQKPESVAVLLKGTDLNTFVDVQYPI